MNNSTRRHPRTLQEAFGPYACGPIHPMPERDYGARWWLALAVLAVVTLSLVIVTA